MARRGRHRVRPNIADRWYNPNDSRSELYGRKGRNGTPDPSRYIARWKPPHAPEQSKTFPTVDHAERWLRQQRTAHDAGDWIRPDRSNVRVAQVRDAWWPVWQQRGSRGRKPKPSSVAAYDRWWRLLVEPTFGSKPIGTIRTSHVTQWASDLASDGYSGSTIRRAHTVLRSILDHALHEDRLTRNPADGARLPAAEGKSSRAALNGSQVLDLADAIVNATRRPQPQYRTLVLLLAGTGLRFGEAVGLTVRDLDLTRRHNGSLAPVAHVRRTVSPVDGRLVEGLPKSGKARTVALPSYLAHELSQLVEGRKPGDRVFTSPRGQVLRESTFRKFHWKPAIKQIDREGLVPHELRHTAATEMLRRGVPITVVANQLGHASPEITARVYAHLIEDDLTIVGEALQTAFSETVSERRRNDGPDLRAV